MKRRRVSMRTMFRNLILWVSASAFGAIPQFQLRDTNGVAHTAEEWSGSKAILLFFVTIDCPVTNSYVPEMNRIARDYAPQGVRTYAVQADTSVADTDVEHYVREYRYQFPLLFDPRQILVEFSGATAMPQAALLAPDGRVLYRGRIDNRVEDFGRQRPEATAHDLRAALDAFLAGQPVGVAATKSIGCAIPKFK